MVSLAGRAIHEGSCKGYIYIYIFIYTYIQIIYPEGHQKTNSTQQLLDAPNDSRKAWGGKEWSVIHEGSPKP